jgi:hypothetical protein
VLEKKPQKMRWLVVINSPIVIWLLSVILITLGGGYYTAYRQCIGDGRLISLTYTTYKYEIVHRQNAIVKAISDATTIAVLRKALEEKIYFNSELKDKTFLELLSSYRAAYLRIDRSGIDHTAERTLTSSPLSRFTSVFVGSVPDTLKDSDLPELKLYALQVQYVNFLTSLNSLITVYEARCTPSNVVQIALGKSPILMRAVQGNFVEREKSDERLNEGWPIDSMMPLTPPP